MTWKPWVLAIVGSLATAGITSSVQNCGRAEASDVKIQALEKTVDAQQATLMKIVPLLERIDERVGEIRRRVERLENASK